MKRLLLPLIVGESSNISGMSADTYTVDGDNMTHYIKNSNTRYFFIKLQKNNEVIDYKAVLKTY